MVRSDWSLGDQRPSRTAIVPVDLDFVCMSLPVSAAGCSHTTLHHITHGSTTQPSTRTGHSLIHQAVLEPSKTLF